MSATVPSRQFRIDLGAATAFATRDLRWGTKLGLGALFALLTPFIVGYLLVQGYLLTFMERVSRAEPLPLPEWEDYGELFSKGAIMAVVNFVYFTPYILLYLFVQVGNVALPLAFPGSSASGSGAFDPTGLLPVGFSCLGWLALLLTDATYSAIRPAAHAQLVLANGDLASAFHPGKVFGFIGRYGGQYALAVLLLLLIKIPLGIAGNLACCIGVFVTNALGQMFVSHLVGQLCWHERTSRPSPADLDA